MVSEITPLSPKLLLANHVLPLNLKKGALSIPAGISVF
jgi:hypothetical protein